MRSDLARSRAQRRSAAPVLVPPDGQWHSEGGAAWGYLPVIAAPGTRASRKAVTAARAALAVLTISLRVLLLIPVAFFVLLFIVATLGSVFASGPW
jgi:hypothetical protein